jgi:subtilisin family serine protease
MAGPPFRTDDPEPVDLGHWEVYGFTAGTHVRGDTAGTLAGVEVNYGAAPNLQLHMVAPLAFDRTSGSPSQ